MRKVIVALLGVLAVVVVVGQAMGGVAIPILEYKFNETGNTAVSTGSDTTSVDFFSSLNSGTPVDLHTIDGGGVSGLAGDRAFDNTSAAGHGPYNAGGIAHHSTDDESIDGLTSFTLTGWLNPDTVISNNGTIIYNQEPVPNGIYDRGFSLSAGSYGQLELEAYDFSGPGGHVTSNSVYTETDWFFFAVS